MAYGTRKPMSKSNRKGKRVPKPFTVSPKKTRKKKR